MGAISLVPRGWGTRELHALIRDSQGWSNILTGVMLTENISQEPSEPSELHLPKSADLCSRNFQRLRCL